jgi:hypothetical protein
MHKHIFAILGVGLAVAGHHTATAPNASNAFRESFRRPHAVNLHITHLHLSGARHRR